MSFEIHQYENGQYTVRDTNTLQIMHSKIGPMEEARLLYFEQTGLPVLFADSKDRSEIVIWDVGFGAGSNSLYVLNEFVERRQGDTKIHMVSFDCQIESIRLLLDYASNDGNKDAFSLTDKFKSLLQELLQNGHARLGDFSWELKVGNFASEFESTPRPDYIFYDMYAPATSTECWGLPVFEKLYRYLTQTSENKSSVLFTYSASSRIRAAMILAGFKVGKGRHTDAKRDTTIAAIDSNQLQEPLGKPWLEQLSRSSHPIPYDCDFTREQVLERVSEKLIHCVD